MEIQVDSAAGFSPSIHGVCSPPGEMSVQVLCPFQGDSWWMIAAVAKSLQLCPTLCDPIDGSPPGSPRPWDSPGKSTAVGAISFSNARK